MTKIFNNTIGYSDINNYNKIALEKKINLIFTLISKYFDIRCQSTILVAGCGNGAEAKIIANKYNSVTYGIDISYENNQDNYGDNLYIQKQDVTHMNFRNSMFDLVYSYHVLEHVNNPQLAIKEMHRVMRIGGILFIGFPNRNRLVAYLGSHNNVTMKEKLLWNINDYSYRIKGKFKNEYGAHAGFTQKEFLNIAGKHFKNIIPVRDEYMVLKYQKYNKLLMLSSLFKINEYMYPSNYYICMK
jgi:2-polyprenyl-3-methyl-5-hydroxy-6-metoxy-1,4-benzoquinol methylase